MHDNRLKQAGRRFPPKHHHQQHHVIYSFQRAETWHFDLNRVMAPVKVDLGGDQTLHPDIKSRLVHMGSEPGQMEHGGKKQREVVDGSQDENIKQRDTWRLLWGATGIYVAYLFTMGIFKKMYFVSERKLKPCCSSSVSHDSFFTRYY
jgi:hypothetical protein